MKKQILGLCVAQEWEEAERGWGVRPDGFSIHRSEEDRLAFIQSHWDSLPDDPPDTYSRPAGPPTTTELTEAMSTLIGSSRGEWVLKLKEE